MDNLPYFTIFKGFSIFLGLFTSILRYFDPQIVHNSQHTTESRVQCYILLFYTYLSQTGEMEMDNLPYFTIFKGFSIFLGLFTSILSYFDPQIALNVPNTPESGVCYIHSIILYRSKSNWRDGDHFIEF